MIDEMVKKIKKECGLNEDEALVFKYGYELFLNSVAVFFNILMIGALCGYLIQSFLFFCCYSYVKKDTGGYHAKSHVSCIFQFNMAYVLLLVMYYFTELNFILVFVTCVVSVVIIFLYAPVVSKDRYLLEEEVIGHKKYAQIKILILCGICLLGEIIFHNTYTDFMYLAVCMITITVILGRATEDRAVERQGD